MAETRTLLPDDELFEALKFAFEHSAEAGVILDTTATVLHMNATADELAQRLKLGYSREALIGRSAWDLLNAVDGLKQMEMPKRLLLMLDDPGAAPIEFEDTYGPTGRAFMVHMRRNNAYIVVELHDITKERAADRAKDQFLATLSHELRNPMTSLLGWGQFGLQRAVELNDTELIEALQQILNAAGVQHMLIGDLLEASRIATGKLEVKLEVIDLRDVVQSVFDSMRFDFESRAIRQEFSIEPGQCFVSGDAQRLRQVLLNILKNALKFTPAGGSIRVELGKHAGRAQVSICDTGIGIDPEFLPHVFERFRQADGSNTRTHGGLGLGLSIAHYLVKRHGGEIEVASEGLGHGTTFTVSLPFVDPPTPAAGFDDTLRGRNVVQSLEGMRVLVVDDEEGITLLLQRILEKLGAEVRTASSGAAALEIVADWAPDALLSDIVMPGMDGHRLVEEMRRRFGPKLVAFGLTGLARQEDVDACVRSGFDASYAKPVDLAALADGLARLVRERRG